MDGELYSRFQPIWSKGAPMSTASTAFPLSYPDQARQTVVDHFNGTRDPSDSDRYVLKMEDVYVVWFCKTLQNWKALVSTILPDLTYYEVTYNGNENVIYLDVYTKTLNKEIPCGEPITRMAYGTVPDKDLGGATELPKETHGSGKPRNLMGSGELNQPAPYRIPYD